MQFIKPLVLVALSATLTSTSPIPSFSSVSSENAGKLTLLPRQQTPAVGTLLELLGVVTGAAGNLPVVGGLPVGDLPVGGLTPP